MSRPDNHEYKSTMVELVQELEKIQPRTPKIQEIIDEARAGEYHDYKNEKYVCGKVAASWKLRDAGLIELARQIENGVYDEKPDEQDRENMRRDVIENCKDPAATNAMISALGLGDPI